MDYNLYLFSNLVKFYDKKFDELPYDLQFDLLPSMYEDYMCTIFSLQDKSEYDCIIDYLKDKYSIKTKIDSKILEKAKQYLCSDNDTDLENQITNIVNTINRHELIDYVDDVVVWSKLEFEFTCQEFLTLIGLSK